MSGSSTRAQIQWNLSWETTAMRDHLSWKTTHFFAEGPTLQYNWTCHQRPHVLRDNILLLKGWSFKTGSTVLLLSSSKISCYPLVCHFNYHRKLPQCSYTLCLVPEILSELSTLLIQAIQTISSQPYLHTEFYLLSRLINRSKHQFRREKILQRLQQVRVFPPPTPPPNINCKVSLFVASFLCI